MVNIRVLPHSRTRRRSADAMTRAKNGAPSRRCAPLMRLAIGLRGDCT